MNAIFSILITIVTGLIDCEAFDLSPKIWKSKNRNKRIEVFFKAYFLFILGAITFIFSTYFMYKDGIENSLTITLIWFVVTIVSLSFIKGSFMKLPRLDRVISFVAIVLIGILFYRGVA